MTILISVDEPELRTVQGGAVEQLVEIRLRMEMGHDQLPTVSQHGTAPHQPAVAEVVANVRVASHPAAVQLQQAFTVRQHGPTIVASAMIGGYSDRASPPGDVHGHDRTT